MAGEWIEQTIGDVATVVGGGTPSTKDPDNFNGEIPWLTPKDLSGYPFRFISRGERNISQKGYNSSNAKLVPKGSVLLTTRAPVGYVAIASNPVTTNQGFHSLVLKDGYNSEFVYYLLKGHTEYLCSNATGTTYGELSGSALKRLKFRFPPLTHQRAIACILGALDDKIELNRRMNETLEQIAQAIFKKWFIEPTKNGKLPEGWREGTLGETITIHDAKRIPLSGRERFNRKGKYPYYGAASVMDYVDDYLFDGVYVLIGEDGSVINTDDTPVLQYVWGQFWVNNHAHVLTGRSGVSVEHLFLFLKNVNIRPFVTGAVQPKLNQANLCRIPFVLSPEPVNQQFASLINPFFTRYRANADQSRTLAALRDALLPKLLSGELRVPDAEKICARGASALGGMERCL